MVDAGTVVSNFDVNTRFAVLFFGGMLIFPISASIVQLVSRREPVSKANPGGLTVIETVFPMIGGLFAAWLIMPYRPEFVFPLAALAVGTHYFGFRTAYGDWTNWALGGAIAAVGCGSIIAGIPHSSFVPFIVATIEIVVGVWLVATSLAKEGNSTTTGSATD